MPKMRIGIVCPYDIIKGGGVQEIVKAQAEGLRKRGHDVIVITPQPPGYDGPPPDKHTVFVGRSTDVRLPTRTTIQVSSNGREAADELLEREQFDILHFHEPWVPSLGAYMLPRSNAISVATFHAKLPEGFVIKAVSQAIRPLAKAVIKYIDVFAAASIPGSEYVSSMTDEPVAYVPVDIDLTQFRPSDKQDDDRPDKTILYVGRLEGRKGVNYLLQAFARLQDKYPTLKLDILGDGVDRPKLELLAEDLELRNVEFLGFRDNGEKIRRFQEADVYCSPALFGEGFGKVLLEAMATGVPTVAGDNPGYASVMTGFGAVSLVNPRDVRDFARRLELMLYQKDLRKLWRKWAAKEVQQYSTERMLDKYEALYREALKNGKRA